VIKLLTRSQILETHHDRSHDVCSTLNVLTLLLVQKEKKEEEKEDNEEEEAMQYNTFYSSSFCK
jgi:aspartate carbamoyltransferase catalytic subunit